MNNQKKVHAIVVTYNRKDLLRQCLNVLLMQTYTLDRIILIDNNSIDGTQEMLDEQGYLELPKIDYQHMLKNLGGAGGFYEGIKRAYEQNADWIWIMDDDTIPQTDTLEKLIGNIELTSNVSFLASCVTGPEGEPMNVPIVDNSPTKNGYSDWYMALKKGLVKIEAATFVSILINRKAIEKCGFPCKDLFIWGDDIEYTTRLSRQFGPAYLVGSSWVCHKRIQTKALDIFSETNKIRVKNYRYYYRNILIITKYYKKKTQLFITAIRTQLTALRAIFSGKYWGIRFMTIEKGVMEYLLYYGKFSNYITNELNRNCIDK